MVGLLKSALEQHEVQRVQARVRRHRMNTEQTQAAPKSSTIPAVVEAQSGCDLASELGINLFEDEEMESSSSNNELSDGYAKEEGDAVEATSAGKSNVNQKREANFVQIGLYVIIKTMLHYMGQI